MLAQLESRPCGRFSAGAAIAATRAVVGRWLLAGKAVCPADSAEDLEELGVVAGLVLMPFAVEAHLVRPDADGVRLTSFEAGDSFDVPG